MFGSLATYNAATGGLRHLYSLTPAEVSRALRFNWLTQPFVVMGFVFGKISVALLLLRIIGPNTVWRKWILYFLMVTAFIFNLLQTIFTFEQCTPTRALWEPVLLETGEAHCWNPAIYSDFGIFTSGALLAPSIHKEALG